MNHLDPTYFTNAEITQVRNILKGLKYGYIPIIVQDGKIVQIDRLEKFRLDKDDQERR